MKKYFLTLVFILSVFMIVSCEKKVNIKVDKEVKSPDYLKVEAAIKDYVEGLYLVDSTRIDKSVDKKLRKIGYWYHPDKKMYVDN